MKKTILFACVLLCSACMTFTACSEDNDEVEETTTDNQDQTSGDLGDVQLNAWKSYMMHVASLLNNDSKNLYDRWNNEFAAKFKAHSAEPYSSAKAAVQQIVDGCNDIASEVGSAKIGDPYKLAKAGKTVEAVLAVESWYSWHSIEDYANNIYSIRNAWYGTRTGTRAENSLYKFVAESNSELAQNVENHIQGAISAIQAIPKPFRNNITSTKSEEAMLACTALSQVLKNDLSNFVNSSTDEARMDAIIKQYVDVVVMPTYNDLRVKNNALYQAVVQFNENPSDEALSACAKAWLDAREPWETSEAFLFGPVADLGLDPNMDSWPLDQAAIQNILTSNAWNTMEWSGEYFSEDDLKDELLGDVLAELGFGEDDELTEEQEEALEEALEKAVEEKMLQDPSFKANMEKAQSISAAQNVRGFHTLEYLIFKDGKARKVSEAK